MPSLLVSAWISYCVPRFCRTIFAPGTTAPDGSATVPVISPFCTCAKAPSERIRKVIHTQVRDVASGPRCHIGLSHTQLRSLGATVQSRTRSLDRQGQEASLIES